MVRAGDIIGVTGRGFLSRSIVMLTGPGPLSHVGIVTAETPLVLVTQALAHVETLTLESMKLTVDAMWAFEWIGVTEVQRLEMINTALSYEGRGYGYGDILLQAADSVADTRMFTEKWSERKFPICSMLTEIAATSAGLNLGIDAKSITPNDIWRFAQSHSEVLRVEQLK